MTEDIKNLETLKDVPKNYINKNDNVGPEEPKGVSVLNAENDYINKPNENLMIIEEIEGLISQASKKIDNLPVHTLRNQLHQEINDIQTTTLKELKKALE